MSYKEVFAELFSGVPMKVRYGLCFLLGIMVVGIPWISSCSSVQKAIDSYPQDNAIEEILEEYIETKIGLDIDLTPYSPEK